MTDLEAHELLRFSTAGSVDDGKSTLIGRLLYDAKSIFEDQLEAIERSTQKRGREGVDLALLTDGLAAEREQGITIDVAYRYFATPKRKFIIADTPGHEQYTRNMVTGASTCDAALILVDASKGLLPQSRRHAYIAKLLGIQHIIVCINKMDLVDYKQERFEEVQSQFKDYVKGVSVSSLHFVPVSALHGDNVVSESDNMPWYQGPTVLHLLETLDIAEWDLSQGFRMPVQYVNRPTSEFRGYAGTVASGSIKAGDAVKIMPQGHQTKIDKVVTLGGGKDLAQAGEAITLTLQDDYDISRGDVITSPESAPQVSQEFTADVCWMVDEPLQVRKKYILKHASKLVKAMVVEIDHKVDINSLATQTADALSLNDIGVIRIKTLNPLCVDDYSNNRTLGSFILIDETHHNTVAAGMVRA